VSLIFGLFRTLAAVGKAEVRAVLSFPPTLFVGVAELAPTRISRVRDEFHGESPFHT
jgi:hypothetical protein